MTRHYTILAICFLVFACNKINNNFASVASSAYFPNRVGDYWKYKYVDSVANKSGFVEVNIVGNTMLPMGQKANIWVFSYSDHKDTNFVYQVDDTIIFAISQAIPKTYLTVDRYIAPFAINNKWSLYPSASDSAFVIQAGGPFLNGKNFINSFLIYENLSLPNDYSYRLLWYCPYIGVITKNYWELYSMMGPDQHTNVYWELLEYSLK